jgi:hypothetical protein
MATVGQRPRDRDGASPPGGFFEVDQVKAKDSSKRTGYHHQLGVIRNSLCELLRKPLLTNLNFGD